MTTEPTKWRISRRKLLLAGILAGCVLLFCMLIFVEGISLLHEGAERRMPGLGAILHAIKRVVAHHIAHRH